MDQEMAGAQVQFLIEELKKEREDKKAMQHKMDEMMAMMLQMKEERDKEKKQAEKEKEEEQQEESKLQKEIREVERDRKSACDQVRMTSLVKAYIAKHGVVKDQNDYERKLLPYMQDFFDNERTPKNLWDLSAPAWDPKEETLLAAKKRKEFYFFVTNVVCPTNVGEKLETAMKAEVQNNAQALWRKLSKVLRRGETEGDGNKALAEFLKCTMASTGKAITSYGAEIKRYQNLMIDLGMPQDEEKMVVAQYLKGMPNALDKIRTEMERLMDDGKLEKKIDAVMKEAESFAVKKDLLEYKVKHQNNQSVSSAVPGDGSKAQKRKEKRQKKKIGQNVSKKKEKELEEIKKKLEMAEEVARQLQQSVRQDRQWPECKYGNECKRSDCKFTHKTTNKPGPKSQREETWCGECNKHTNHTTEEHGKCWNCGEKGHRNYQCPKKTNTQKGGKTTIFAGNQSYQEVEVGGRRWYSFQQCNLQVRVKPPAVVADGAEVLKSDDELPVFQLPKPAMGMMKEILTKYVSCGSSQTRAELVGVPVPQPKKKHRKGKARVKKRRIEKAVKSKAAKCKAKEGRRKQAKHKRTKMKKSKIKRKVSRMRAKRCPVRSSVFKKFFKLEWHVQGTLSQRRRARRRERARRANRQEWVKDRKEKFLEKLRKKLFKMELLDAVAKRKSRIVRRLQPKVMVELKSVMSKKQWRKNIKQLVQRRVTQLATCEEGYVKTILDSGAMANSGCSSSSKISRLKKLRHPVEVKGCTGSTTTVTQEGEWDFETRHPHHNLTLQHVLDIPGSDQNLISVGCLDDAGLTVVFKHGEGRVYAEDGGLLLIFKKIGGLYELWSGQEAENKMTVSEQGVAINGQTVMNWDVQSLLSAHEVLNHLGFNTLRKLLNLPPETMTSPNPVCKSCLCAHLKHGKLTRQGLRAAPRYGYRLHSDTSRKLPTSNALGKTGIQRFQLTGDEFTGTLWLDLLSRKSEAKHAIIERIDKINNELGGNPVVEHQTDSGTEYLNKWLDKKLRKRNVEPRNSAPHQKHENGWIEIRMHLLQKGAAAYMFRGHAPPCDYPYALRHWVQQHDIIPNPVTGMTPYEKRVGIAPSRQVKHIQGPLFCLCYAKIYVNNKLQQDAVKCIYMGKDPRSDGVLVRQIGGKVDGTIVRAGVAVKFVPNEFPYAHAQVPRPPELKAFKYDSDSDEGEDEIQLFDDKEEIESQGVKSESETDYYTEGSEESEDDDEDADDEEDEKKHDDDKPQPKAKKNKMFEPEPEYESADGDIDGEDAWEVVEIVDERRKKRGKRHYVQYKVVWKGDYPDEWIYKSRLKAPDVVKAWTEKKQVKQNSLNMVGLRYCQLNQCVEPVTPNVIEGERNPFKDLFDPKSETRPENPKGYKNMMKHKFAEYFVQALIKEKLENQKWKAYEEVPRSSVPKGAKILRPMTAYQIKYNAMGEIEKFKSRVCLDGSRTKVDEAETYEAIADFGTIRMLLCLATRYDMDLVQTDVKNFFLQATMPEDKTYYCEIPDGWAENDPDTHVAKVLAPWYGLKESAKLAGDQLAEALKEAGMEENPLMPKVFWKWDGDDLIICANHIDDAAWLTTNMEKLNKTLDKVEEKFVLDRTYKPTKLLGIEIDYDKVRGLMKLHQGSYNRAKAKEMGVEGLGRKPAKSPGHIPPKIVNPLFPGGNTVQADAKDVRRYQKKIGVHMWSLQTDPSSMYTVYQLAKHMLNPQKEHWDAMRRLDNYKACHPEIGIVFRRAASKEKLRRGQNLDCITFFADADLAGDQRDAKSTSGWCVHMGESGMFDWKSKKQTCVCQSSCEAEIYAAKECTCYAVWLRSALGIMGFTFTKPTPIAQDNSSAIATCTSSKHHSRQRHFRMHVNLLRDYCNKRVTTYPWVPTKQMRGDLFNKTHQPVDHIRLCQINGIHAEELKYITDEPTMIQLDSWTDEQKSKTK